MTQRATTMRLKGFWRDRKHSSASLWHKLKEFRLCLKLAWQRAYKGYDSWDVDELGFRTCERLIAQLSEFCREQPKYTYDPVGLEAAQKIKFLLRYYEEGVARWELFPDENELSFEQNCEVARYSAARIKEAFELFAEYYLNFWI